MDDRLETNRRRWDELVPIHAASRFYDVDAFLAGRCTLLPIVPTLVRGDDGLFRLPDGELSLPTSFSIRAAAPSP